MSRVNGRWFGAGLNVVSMFGRRRGKLASRGLVSGERGVERTEAPCLKLAVVLAVDGIQGIDLVVSHGRHECRHRGQACSLGVI